MPVQVVLGDIQHGGSGRLKPFTAVQLETGQFKHPHLRQGLRHGVNKHRGNRGDQHSGYVLLIHIGIGINICIAFNNAFSKLIASVIGVA